jgi:predicted short-subunit dehydrogenase-like oxidoreductase (DUF2520 family)
MENAIGIVGAGRVAQALGRLLYEAGEPVSAIASRTSDHAKAAAAFIGPAVESCSCPDLARRVSRVLVCVPDASIEAVARALDGFEGIALHTAGARGPEALAALEARGVACGVLHPLQTIAGPDEGVSALAGIAFAVWGDEAALRWAERIAAIAGGRILRIDPASRPLYHAAAVMASNYVVSMLSAAQTLMEAAGVGADEARAALAPLARTSLENALRLGPAAALTGPIERGDLATVAAHLKALAAAPERIQNLYRAAGLEALAIAGLDAARTAAMAKALEAKAE